MIIIFRHLSRSNNSHCFCQGQRLQGFLCTGYQSGDGNYLNELATVKVREISYIYFFVNSEVVQKYEMAEASW